MNRALVHPQSARVSGPQCRCRCHQYACCAVCSQPLQQQQQQQQLPESSHGSTQPLFNVSPLGTPAPAKSSPFDAISDEALHRICFAEMLTISRCAHRTTRTTTQSASDSVLLDLNQLHRIGSMFVGVRQPMASELRQDAYALYQYDDTGRLEIRETRAHVDRNLRALHSKQAEISRFGGMKSDREWYRSVRCRPLGGNGNGNGHGDDADAHVVLFSRSNDIGNAFQEQRLVHGLSSGGTQPPFIAHGASLLWQRYWTVTGFVGTVEAQTLDIEGQVCRVQYECGRRRPGRLNGSQMEIVRIRQTLYRSNATIEVSKSIYLASGHLLRQKFQFYGRSFVVHFNPLSDGIPPEPAVDAVDFGEKGLRRFLAHVTETGFKERPFGEYIEANPEVRSLVQYYVLSLIAVKPVNVLEYSIDYFMKLGLDKNFVY